MNRSLCCTLIAVTCLAGGLFVPASVMAQASSHVANAAPKLTAEVTVPSNGDAVTYVDSDGEKVTIAPGETKTIPAGATAIKLPKGTVFTVTTIPTEQGATASANTYTLSKAVTLGTLSAKVLKAKSDAFVLTGQTGDIKLPPGAMIDLINEIARVPGGNPFGYKAHPPTDGN